MATAPVAVRGTFGGWRGATAAGCALAIGAVAAVNIAAGVPVIPLLGIAAVFASAGVLIGTRPGRAGAAIALVAAGVFLVPAALAFPNSFAWANDPVEFTVSAAIAVALGLVVFGSVAVLVRGSESATTDSDAPRGLIILGAFLVIAALVTSLALRMTVVDAEAAAGDLDVAIRGFRFPAVVTAEAGSGRLFVTNADRGAHTFTVDELNIDLVVPGQSASATSVRLRPGRYGIRCRIPGHTFMRSSLLVN